MVTLLTVYFHYLRENYACSEVNTVGLGSTYFYPSLERGDDVYRKCIDKTSLWEYENVIIPVHLPREEHWFLLVISIINLRLYIYDSASSHSDTCKTVFETIKNNFIKKECELLSSEGSKLFHENNWDEKLPKCPKQMNKIDCGVFTCLLAKHLISGEQCNNADIKVDHPRDEMASDLLNLATAGTNRVQDLPENLQWILKRMRTRMNRQKVSLTEKSPVQVSVIASLRHVKTETAYFTQWATNSHVWESPLRQHRNFALVW